MAATSVQVLLVEDSPEEADLTRLLLQQATNPTYSVERVDCILPAARKLREGYCPDVILLDLQLPDCEGLEGFRTLRRIAPRVPVVMLTNMPNEEIAAKAVREGAQDYLLKRDVDNRLLQRAIRYACERQRAEDALRESEERYALAVAGASDGIWDWRLDRRHTYYSPRWGALIGESPEQIGTSIEEWFKRVHPSDIDALRAKIRQHLNHGSTHFEHEHRIRHARGDYIWVLARGLAVRDSKGQCLRMAGSLTDITDRKKTEEQLLHDALHDSLTGLPNRSLFQDRLAQALRRYRRNADCRFAVLYFDLDRFKYVNDSLGHSAGDELLVAVADVLKRCLRPGDTLARLGGDEFAILLNDMEALTDAEQVADRIHEMLADRFSVQGHDIYTSASVGIATAHSDYESAEQILRDSDLAMYRAKRREGPQTAIYDDDMHNSAVAQLRLETDLRRAFQEGEFHVHYQPIVSLRSGRINAFEALIRWQHPIRGLLSPDDFIQKAEETGIIVQLDWWTLEQACQQTAEWQRSPAGDRELGINVNISGKILREAEVADRIIKLLARCNLAPRHLRLELTERAFMDHHPAAVDALDRLRAAGVQLYIDDFGTGYSSLSYLQQYAYDTLKIDKSFVQRINSDTNDSSIVTAIVTLGKMLKMNIVAEGVETSHQMQALRGMECPEAQGFWFSKPVNDSDAHLLLREPLAAY